MIKNGPTLAIVAVDTDENELSKVRQLDGRARCNIGIDAHALEDSVSTFTGAPMPMYPQSAIMERGDCVTPTFGERRCYVAVPPSLAKFSAEYIHPEPQDLSSIAMTFEEQKR